jgi:phosphoglycerol geranylgeranyltransferase
MVFDYLQDIRNEGRAGYLALLDPESCSGEQVPSTVRRLCAGGVDGILVGGSTCRHIDFPTFVAGVRKASIVPVILFPGSADQLAPAADAIFFLSLVSGRNSRYLIGEHVKAAPLIHRMGLETIPVGYLLIDSGSTTSVVDVSDTTPIARDDIEGAQAHALAAHYLGMKIVYLEAGSGATHSVPPAMITAVRQVLPIPIIVGGGIRSPEVAVEKVRAGADFVVTGNALERDPSLVPEIAKAIRSA